MSNIRIFPQSLSLLGLTPGFTPKQFSIIMELERSDELRQLAHQEWEAEQAPEYDNTFNYRWYLSYVSMKNEYTKYMAYRYKNKKNQAREP